MNAVSARLAEQTKKAQEERVVCCSGVMSTNSEDFPCSFLPCFCQELRAAPCFTFSHPIFRRISSLSFSPNRKAKEAAEAALAKLFQYDSTQTVTSQQVWYACTTPEGYTYYFNTQTQGTGSKSMKEQIFGELENVGDGLERTRSFHVC